ncbi:potassium-transporting ATPase subunit KdpA [Nostoc sp. ChiSLP03a]|uniref:potassium-transporting ATPase subunit KdpA n=1 Tax=Nostoc sp. ChiSLP03a TaxID=3075380 RepID=UPI00391A702E
MMSVPILGHYLAEVFFIHKTWLDLVMNPLERLIYLLIDIEPQKSMTGREYAIAVLFSNTAMAILASIDIFSCFGFRASCRSLPTCHRKITFNSSLSDLSLYL